MTHWTIDALRVGRLIDLPREAIVFRASGEPPISVPMIMFVIRSAGRVVVVDTGGPTDVERVVAHHGLPYHCDPDENPVAVLESVGLVPEDIDIVVNTHLHWDHASNNHLFTRAEHWVQRAELDYAVHPAPPNHQTYEVTREIKPLWLDTLDRMRLADGQHDLLEGLTLIPLPGHSPGSQGVAVTTAEGKYLIAGDCVNTYENLLGTTEKPPRMSGGYTDMVAFAESLDRIQREKWTVIPSHDHAVVDRRRFG